MMLPRGEIRAAGIWHGLEGRGSNRRPMKAPAVETKELAKAATTSATACARWSRRKCYLRSGRSLLEECEEAGAKVSRWSASAEAGPMRAGTTHGLGHGGRSDLMIPIRTMTLTILITTTRILPNFSRSQSTLHAAPTAIRDGCRNRSRRPDDAGEERWIGDVLEFSDRAHGSADSFRLMSTKN